MSYMAGMLRLRKHNRDVEIRRKERKRLASIAGAKGREWSAARAATKAWTPTQADEISPLKKMWVAFTSHLGFTKKVECATCKKSGVIVKFAKGKEPQPVRCNACEGRGWIRKKDATKWVLYE